ncbi:tRNA threonylcarbamoyladenosine dehydratase [Christensenellaceae bacterium 44-20]
MNQEQTERERLIRTEMLLGEAAMERLRQAHVAVFGIGGVGGYAVEALARSGVGALTLIDHDVISASNLNRQIIATQEEIGSAKVDVMRRRIASIAPSCQVQAHCCFFLPETAEQFDFSKYDYVIDAVDTVSAKIEIILRAKQANIPVISCMGTGNKLDPAQLEVAWLEKTSVCPLARVMRRELRARGITDVKVVYSKEMPRTPLPLDGQAGRKRVPASAVFVPGTAGLMLASQVVRELTGQA